MIIYRELTTLVGKLTSKKYKLLLHLQELPKTKNKSPKVHRLYIGYAKYGYLCAVLAVSPVRDRTRPIANR